MILANDEPERFSCQECMELVYFSEQGLSLVDSLNLDILGNSVEDFDTTSDIRASVALSRVLSQILEASFLCPSVQNARNPRGSSFREQVVLSDESVSYLNSYISGLSAGGDGFNYGMFFIEGYEFYFFNNSLLSLDDDNRVLVIQHDLTGDQYSYMFVDPSVINLADDSFEAEEIPRSQYETPPSVVISDALPTPSFRIQPSTFVSEAQWGSGDRVFRVGYRQRNVGGLPISAPLFYANYDEFIDASLSLRENVSVNTQIGREGPRQVDLSYNFNIPSGVSSVQASFNINCYYGVKVRSQFGGEDETVMVFFDASRGIQRLSGLRSGCN